MLKRFSINLVNEWSQLRKINGYNWYIITLITLALEFNTMVGIHTFYFNIVGLGFELRYNSGSRLTKDKAKNNVRTN